MKLVIKTVPVHMIRGFCDLAEIKEKDSWLFDVRYVLLMLEQDKDTLLYGLARTSKTEGYDYMYLRGIK